MTNDLDPWKLRDEWLEFLLKGKYRFYNLYSCQLAATDPTRKTHGDAVKQLTAFRTFLAVRRLTS